MAIAKQTPLDGFEVPITMNDPSLAGSRRMDQNASIGQRHSDSLGAQHRQSEPAPTSVRPLIPGAMHARCLYASGGGTGRLPPRGVFAAVLLDHPDRPFPQLLGIPALLGHC